MPRGIPKIKQINDLENNMKKELDNKNPLENLASISLVEEKIDEQKPAIAVPEIKKDDSEYTTSPDGKYKILKPKKHADFLDKQPSRIPYFTREGYEIYWPTDREPNSIPQAISLGWEFADPNTSGCENARNPVYAGTRPDGSAYHHYAMWMPKEKHSQIQAMRQKAISDKEQEILKKPSDETSAIYATEQMKLGATRIVPKVTL